MESEASLANEQQFWDELQEIVSTPCSSEDNIDDALRAYLNLVTKYKDEYLLSDLDISRCSYKLLFSGVFAAHGDYVRRQMIYGLLQDDDPDTLLFIASFILFDGRQNEIAFRMMNEEGSFPRLLELLQAQNRQMEDNEAGLHRLLMGLLYEMSRIQRVRIQDLVLVDDDFIKGLFNIIEDLSYDANDPYHYSVIRILLVLNEQFMISAHDPVGEQSSSTPLTNRVIKILSMHGNRYKTFGENIILLINREAETSLQLLTLKLLYLIFTTPSTYEYFYTNDLHVLVDILIRNLLDLPEEAAALRHTYLRVLYPLLAHTQLKSPPHYKRNELKRMLSILVRGQLSGGVIDPDKIMHFDEVDETTRRLVGRCATVDWLRDAESDTPGAKESSEENAEPPSSASDTYHQGVNISPLDTARTMSPTSTIDSSSESPTRLDGPCPPSPEATSKPSQIQRLGMHLEPASSSNLSMQEVATQHEKPGVITPSRNDVPPTTESPSSPSRPSAATKPKIKPLPPKTRRWRGRKALEDENNDIIPEETSLDSAVSPSPITPSTPPNQQYLLPHHHHQPADRRNSTTTSNLAPPPVPARRSASNPPPAVPPPRRSTHPAVQAHHATTSHCTPVTSPSRPQQQQPPQQPQPQQQQPPPPPNKGQKPEPPRTRRWGRTKHAQTDSSDKSQGEGEQFPALPETPVVEPNEKHQDNLTVSVEEAVQNVSLS